MLHTCILSGPLYIHNKKKKKKKKSIAIYLKSDYNVKEALDNHLQRRGGGGVQWVHFAPKFALAPPPNIPF